MNLAGVRVKERRSELHWNQDTLCARIAYVTDGAWNPDWRDIVRIEGGRRTISDVELPALAKALETNVIWLIGEDS